MVRATSVLGRGRFSFALLRSAVAALAGLTALVGVTGCGDPPKKPTTSEAQFDPAAGILPFPNDLLFAGSTDGTLNIPLDDESPASDPKRALNELDGFSLIEPMTATFSTPLDVSTLQAGTSVRVFEVKLSGPGGVVTQTIRELFAGREYVTALATPTTLAVVPIVPLNPESSYLVVVTNGLRSVDNGAVLASSIYKIARGRNPLVDADGLSTKPDFIDDETANQLEPLREVVSSWDIAAEANGIASESIVLSFAFSTQSVAEPLLAVREVARQAEAAGALSTESVVAPNVLFTTAAIGGDGSADVFAGALRVPTFLPPGPQSALVGTWLTTSGGATTRFDPTPASTGTAVLPMLVTLPAAAVATKPANGWPVVIFQHGITGNRTFVLAVADTLAKAGYASVAIDLPLHGLEVAATDPLHVLSAASGVQSIYASSVFDGLRPTERIEGVDFVDNTTGEAGPDGIDDPSGTHFINLTNLVTKRDNGREAVADLFFLRASVGSMDVNGNDFDSAHVSFVGHSLGAVVGVPFIALDERLETAVLANPGGSISHLLAGSATFGPSIVDALQAAGIQEGTADFAAFLTAAQTALDASDPVSFSRSITVPYVMFEDAGGAPGALPDQVIPNRVDGAPLAGTEPLIALMNATPLLPGGRLSDARGLQLAVRMSSGSHVSLIDQTADPAVTAEMQRMVATFLASRGTTLDVVNGAVVATP